MKTTHAGLRDGMNIADDARHRERQRQQCTEESDAFWGEVMRRHRHLTPGSQVALAEAIGRFRKAQADLSEAIKRK